MSINQITLEIETLIKEHSRKYNNGEVSYSYVTGYLLGLLKGVSSSLNPKRALEEELENLKRKTQQ